MKQEVYIADDAAKVSPFITMNTRELISTMITGVVVGLLVAIIMMLLQQFVFGAVLCRAQASTDCSRAPQYSMIVAQVVGAIAGIVGLARLRVFRPLLVVIASAISLWGFQTIILGVAWYWGILISAMLFGLSYGAFVWLARARSFVFALVVTIVLVVAVRLVLQG